MKTSENLDLVRSLFAAWERGEWRSVDWTDPEIEVVVVDGPSPGNWRGVAGVAESTRDFISAWESYSLEADEYRELDDERVLVLTHYSGRGKASGIEIAQLGRRARSFSTSTTAR